VRADKIMSLANSVLGGNRGEAIKLIAKGAQMWRDPNAKPEAAPQPGQPAAQPGQPAAQPGQPVQAPVSQASHQQAPYGAPPTPYGAPPAPYGAPPPQAAPPAPPPDEGLEADEWAILRIMAAAAQADGHVAPHEQTTILTQAQKLGASPDQMQQLNFELRQRVSVNEIVGTVDSVAARKLMYQFAFAMVKSDHQVTQTEMAFLTELAKATELSHEVLGQLVRG
jgi:uncharacterized membrane protein YebE (DUF533 family)